MTSNLITVYINDIEVKVLENSTVLQACEKIGVKVPRFCYHEKLSIAGNCRMCLVEIKNAPKLQASCALPVMKDARIYTDSIAVKKAREGIMELLLINHPLDCPICDQGGECDLQDQAMYYGSDHGRFHEYKRATTDKNFGPLIKTIMTRCIHCTRCVRFAAEVAGCYELGTIGRGNNIEISTFVRSNETVIQSVLDSELSGNLVDVCPVGALTSLPYAFVARPWELKSILSVDISDTYCSDIKVDVRGQGPGSILRILPATMNTSWISDKTRFSYDGLKRQRLITPLQKNGIKKTFENKTWDEVFTTGVSSTYSNEKTLKNEISSASQITLFLGQHVDLNVFNVLSKVIKNKTIKLNICFVHNDSNRYNNNSLKLVDKIENFKNENAGNGLNFLNTNSILTTFINDKELEKADLCLLVGTNPRIESPVLNASLQKVAKKGKVILFGSNSEKLPYAVKHLGHSPASVFKFLNSPKQLSSIFKDSAKTSKKYILIGSNIFYRPDSLEMLTALSKFAIEYNFEGIKVLYQSVSELNGFYSSFNVLDTYNSESIEKVKNSNLFIYYNLPNYVLNNPLIKESLKNNKSENLRIYVGSHGNNLTNNCNWILPTTTFTEKVGSFITNAGKMKHTSVVNFAPGLAIQDSLLFNKLFFE